MKKKVTKFKSDVDRDRVILSLHERGLTQEQIGEKFGISHARVWQILNPASYKVCPIHKVKFQGRTGKCFKCGVAERYAKNDSLQYILKRLNYLKPQDRKAHKVYERHLIVKILHERYKHTFGYIGRLFERNVSTIKHLYAYADHTRRYSKAST